MPKLALLQYKQSGIPENLGYCPDDIRAVRTLNRARNRLMQHGRWWGTIALVRFCVTDGCMTWPGWVANFERIALCGQPLPIHNPWYDFIDNFGSVPVCRSCANKPSNAFCNACGGVSARDSLTAPTFSDITGGSKLIRVYASSAIDYGKKVLVQGLDQNKIPIRNQYTGVWVDGEYVILAAPFATSLAQFSTVTGIQKEATVERVLAYQVDPVLLTELPLAIWGPLELNPSYRRSFMPFIQSQCGTCQTSVDALVKIAYQPVAGDTDWLVIDNLTALEHGCRAEEFFAQNRTAEAREQVALALAELNHELRTMTGNRTEIYVDLEGTASFKRVFAGFR